MKIIALVTPLLLIVTDKEGNISISQIKQQSTFMYENCHSQCIS